MAKDQVEKNDLKYTFKLDKPNKVLYVDIVVRQRVYAAEPRCVIRTPDIWEDVERWCKDKRIFLVTCSKGATISNDLPTSGEWTFEINVPVTKTKSSRLKKSSIQDVNVTKDR